MLETMLPCMDNYLDYIDGLAETGEVFDAKEYLSKLKIIEFLLFKAHFKN